MVLRKVSREEFQRHSSMQLRIFRQIDFAHAAFAEQRENLVMGYDLTASEFHAIKQQFCRGLVSGRINKVARFFVRFEQ